MMTRLGGDRQYVKIDSEEELQEFLSKKTYDGESNSPGGSTMGYERCHGLQLNLVGMSK